MPTHDLHYQPSLSRLSDYSNEHREHDDHHPTHGRISRLIKQGGLRSELIEIQLIDKLDETRSFCIDIKAYKERAKVHRRMQGHTC